MIRWVPWLAGGAMLLGLAFTAKGCSSLKTERARYVAEVERMGLAVKGAENNERVAITALLNKDKRIAELEASTKRASCDGVWVERFGPDGHLSERRCEGKQSSDETITRSKTGSDTTPIIQPPFQPPPALIPGPPSSETAQTRWAIGAGVGISLDPLILPVYYGSVERRLIGPLAAGGWAHFPAMAGGIFLAVRW